VRTEAGRAGRDLLSRSLAVVSLYRPRSLARAKKTAKDLSEAVHDLKLSLKQLQEDIARGNAHSMQLAEQLRRVNQSLADLIFREARLAAIYRRDRELERELDALPRILDLGAVVDHASRALTSARLELQPFPHVVVDDLWPDSFYDALLRGVPPSELFANRPVNKRRLVVPFEWAPVYSRKVWDFFVYEVLDKLAPIIVQKFEKPLKEWLASQWGRDGKELLESVQYQSTDGRLLLRSRGYIIPPHRDPKWGFITCLMYLARPSDSERLGTQLYSVSDDVDAPHVSAYWIKPESCRLEKDVPFRRNSMLMLLNSHGAHGARIPEDTEPADLERCLYQFRIGPSPQSIHQLMQALPDERRATWAGKIASYS
jgi:hypothetical protein